MTCNEQREIRRQNAEVARLLREGIHPIQIQQASERRAFQVLHPRARSGRFITRRVRARA